MKRPSFQFYPGDWSGNSNLRRCTHAEKGAWLDVMCLMHDQEEYGVLRWPLKEVAQAVGCPVGLLKGLASKGVLKGSDSALEDAFVYTPRSGRKNGDSVELVPTQAGPIWFSSRMVKDEYVRTIRGESSRFGDGNGDSSKGAPKPSTKGSPKPPFGDGSSSSSSSSYKNNTPLPPGGGLPPGFVRFWDAWPKSPRKVDKADCCKRWKRHGLETLADEIVKHVEAMCESEQWKRGYEPAPATYLNGRRWEDDMPPMPGLFGGEGGAQPWEGAV
ncbi:hypothetical protein ACXU40_09230 [Bordetella bronchiseptica]